MNEPGANRENAVAKSKSQAVFISNVRTVQGRDKLTVDPLMVIDFPYLQEHDFLYCSTCKRVEHIRKFSNSVRTCTRCLSNSRKRAVLRRRLTAARSTALKEQKRVDMTRIRMFCSSCKCIKLLSCFSKRRKTCATCTLRRQLAS